MTRDITERKRAEEELRWKTAFLEAQVNSSIDGILVVDRHGKKILQNRRLNELWKIPQHIADDPDDEKQIQWVTDMAKNSKQFIDKVLHLYAHPDEISHDEVELKDGMVLDRYSSPVTGKDGEYYGRIWTFRDITERKQAETALQRQQAEMRALFDLIPALIWFKNTENGILRINQRAAETAGKPVAEIEGKSTFEVYPQEAAKFYADDLEVIRSGVPKLGIVETLQDREGKDLWIQTDKVPYCDKDGKVIGIVVLSQDITERKRAEESLRLLGTAVEQSQESIVITDAELDLPGPRILFVNPGFTRMTGYTAAEVLGKTPRILQGPRSDRAVLSRLRHALERGEPFHGEILNYRKDGTEFHLEWQVTPIHDANGVTTHFIAIQRDVTERMAAEAKLSTLVHSLESTSELICITNVQDRFTFVNQAFLRAYGYTEEEILGKTPDILFSSKNPSSLMAEVLQQSHVSGWQGEVLDRRKDGTEFPIFLSTSKIRDRSGNIIGLLGVARDVTERKQLEKEILEISDREQSRIGQDLHDDVCQHLASTAYAAGLLEEKLREKLVPEAAQAGEIADLINKAIVQARELARVLHPVKLEAEGLASALHDLATNVTKRTAIACTVDCPELLDMVDTAASIHLFRIAQEAVANAVKHAKPRHIWIRLDVKANTITLAVRDDGCGVAVPLAPFRGMGLDIMRYRARMIGGTLGVSRVSRGGTIVECSFRHKA